MPESAEEVYARVVGVVGPEGRLPMPPQGGWDIFPWEVVDGAIAPKGLRPPSDEPVRRGEGDGACDDCRIDPAQVVWEDDAWVLTHQGGPSGLPLVLILRTREHLDYPELDDERASELGRISVRLVRIMEHLQHVARAHTSRWGDGGAHCHVWFWARTERLTGITGSPTIDWDDVLPPVPDNVWRDDLRRVAAKLANWGGTARA